MDRQILFEIKSFGFVILRFIIYFFAVIIEGQMAIPQSLSEKLREGMLVGTATTEGHLQVMDKINSNFEGHTEVCITIVALNLRLSTI